MVGSDTKGDRGGTRDGRRGHRGRGYLGGGNSMVSCFYCKEPGHIKKFCPKLIGTHSHNYLDLHMLRQIIRHQKLEIIII